MKRISISEQYAPLWVCADISFYFYVVALFSFSAPYTVSGDGGVQYLVTNLIAPWSLQLAILVAACFVLGFLIVRLDSMALRCLLSLLPGLTFLMSPLQPILLIHAAAWVYYVVYMTVGNFEAYLDVYRRRARVMLLAAMLLTFCLIIFHFGTDSMASRRLYGGEIYGLLYYFLTVLALRGMRTSMGASKTLRLLDGAYVIVLPALLVASVFLLRGLVPAITFLISVGARFVLWLGRLLFPNREEPDIFHPLEEEELELTKEPESLYLPEAHDQRPDAGQMGGKDPQLHLADRTMLYLMIAALAAGILCIAILLIRRKKKGRSRPKFAHEHIERMKPAAEEQPRRRSGEPPLSSNVRQIRRTYRAYLDVVRSLSLRITPSDTSKDVLEASAQRLDVPENQALRELYIAARYGDPGAVTPDQAAEAKRCLSAIQTAKSHIPE